jgi:hypothetical protein
VPFGISLTTNIMSNNPQVFFDIAIKGESAGRIVFEVREPIGLKT